MKRGNWIIIAVVIILAGIGIWTWQTSSSKEDAGGIAEELAPDLEVISLNISNISGKRIQASSEVQVHNPFPVELSTKRINYQIFIDSIKVIEDAYDEPVRIASSDSTVIKLPMEILADPLKRVFDYFEKHEVDSARYILNLAFEVDVPVAGEKEFSLDLERTLPSFRLLEAELENLDLNILSGSDGVDIVMLMTNPNSFPITMQDATFYLQIEDKLEISGELEDHIHIPARGTEKVAVSARQERGSLTQTGLSYLFDQKGTEFTYFFQFIMNSDNQMFNDSEINLEVEGNLAEISEAM